MNRQHTLLVKRIEESGKELLAYLAEIPEKEIHESPAPGEWSVHTIMAHLRDTEREVFLKRIRLVLNGGEPAHVENFDQEEWNRQHYSPSEPLKKIVSELRAARRKELALLRELPDRKWSDYCIHPNYGRISIEYIATHNYSHTLEHLHQMLERREQELIKKLNP